MVASPISCLNISIDRWHFQSPISPNANIGEHIRYIRIRKQLFQREVAKIIGVKSTTLENWESNRTQPLLELLPRVFDFLGYVPNQYMDNLRLQNPIFQYRAKNRLGVKAMADLLGVNKSTILSWETGRISMSESHWFSFKSLTSKNHTM